MRSSLTEPGGSLFPTLIAGSHGSQRAQWRGIGSLQNTDLRVEVTATDLSGATATRHAFFRVEPFGSGSSAPSFGETVADQTWTQGRAITALQRPAATGGDLGSFDHDFSNSTPMVVASPTATS